MKPRGVLETVLYVSDLAAAKVFYQDILGLTPLVTVSGRHVFYRVGEQVLLLFDPAVTRQAEEDQSLPVPPHGADGQGHVCFRARGDEITAWRSRLESEGISIEADFEWPNGGRSIYFRDPAGNCIEFAEPRIWGLSDART